MMVICWLQIITLKELWKSIIFLNVQLLSIFSNIKIVNMLFLDAEVEIFMLMRSISKNNKINLKKEKDLKYLRT